MKANSTYAVASGDREYSTGSAAARLAGAAVLSLLVAACGGNLLSPADARQGSKANTARAWQTTTCYHRGLPHTCSVTTNPRGPGGLAGALKRRGYSVR